jgi:hypothetical protein
MISSSPTAIAALRQRYPNVATAPCPKSRRKLQTRGGAFEVDEKLQVELIDDPRFRGVYLLFAQGADRELARRIRDRLVSHAATTGDNGLSNEFVRLFDAGPVNFAEASVDA